MERHDFPLTLKKMPGSLTGTVVVLHATRRKDMVTILSQKIVLNTAIITYQVAYFFVGIIDTHTRYFAWYCFIGGSFPAKIVFKPLFI